MSFKNKVSRKIRAANSLLMALTAIPVALTSIYLYFAPYDAPYRNIWDNLHILLGFVLICSFVLHIPMNWRPIRSYLRTKTRRFARPRAEGFAALTVFVLLMLGGIAYPALSQMNATPSQPVAANATAPVDADSASAAGITPADTSSAKTASANTGTKITYVAADISGCGNCDLIRDEGGCHSGVVFNFKGTVYFGSASGVSYIQQVVDNTAATDADTGSEPVVEAVPEGIDPAAAAQPADVQVAYVSEGGGRHGRRN